MDRVLQELGRIDLPRPAVTAVVRRELASLRAGDAIPDFSAVLHRVRAAIERLRKDRIQPVINGTGIILHTNFGRSPLGAAVAEAVSAVAMNYSNLEYDLLEGERGSRAAYLEHNLALLCGAEASTVVNNCAAALVLIVRHCTAQKREVIISRGELVQIGGGFRIPDILAASGAKLHEVGTTNKTTADDYARAIGAETALILKVHRSNFFMGGFVDSPATEAIAELAHAHQIPFAEDLGSGAMVSTEKMADIEHERTPAEALERGVTLVCCSGDKLLGGPQAGIIAGDAHRVAALKQEPLFRALRCDKLILTALQTTVDIYLAKEDGTIPALHMLQLSCEELHARAEKLIGQLTDLPLGASVGRGDAQLGGGTLPRSVIPSVTLDLAPVSISLEKLSAELRSGPLPIIGYIAAGRFKLDLRTIFPQQDDEISRRLRDVATRDSQVRTGDRAEAGI